MDRLKHSVNDWWINEGGKHSMGLQDVNVYVYTYGQGFD